MHVVPEHHPSLAAVLLYGPREELGASKGSSAARAPTALSKVRAEAEIHHAALVKRAGLSFPLAGESTNPELSRVTAGKDCSSPRP